MENRHKAQVIIELVIESDRNIYFDIVNGSLRSVGYSQGLGDIDLEFLEYIRCQPLTDFIQKKLEKTDFDWSFEHFFPSPHWEQQVQFIDDCIWDFIRLQELSELSEVELADRWFRLHDIPTAVVKDSISREDTMYVATNGFEFEISQEEIQERAELYINHIRNQQ